MTVKSILPLAAVLLAVTIELAGVRFACAQAPSPMIPPGHPVCVQTHKTAKAMPSSKKIARSIRHRYPGAVLVTHLRRGRKKAAPPPPPPQNFVGKLSSETLAPGVVHKVHHGSMFINVLDVDLAKANVTVRPVLAGETFDTLDEVRDQAQKVKAIAAVNGNYFKRDGTPLGTLIINGEWVAGPLYNRTCMGITRDGQILVDRVTLHGTLTTSNREEPSIWVNNINQPRRHGAHLIAYTRRWGDRVDMQYAGTLVAVDNRGEVIGKGDTTIAIPEGGFVLSDSKDSAIAKLNIGDCVSLAWHSSPPEWEDVVNAVSGGPDLVRNGKLYVDCKDECFAKTWTGSQIHARTAVGVTANRHLLLATIEGPHTLFDVAKFFQKMGAVDAMNLDGGGSTTMVIDGKTVTLNSNRSQRRVASALAILPRTSTPGYTDLSRFGVQTYGVTPSAIKSLVISPASANSSSMPAAHYMPAAARQSVPILTSGTAVSAAASHTAVVTAPVDLTAHAASALHTDAVEKQADAPAQAVQSSDPPAPSLLPQEHKAEAPERKTSAWHSFGLIKHLNPFHSDPT